MMKILIPVTISFLFAANLNAQTNSKISGSVNMHDQQVIAGATVRLLRNKDSSTVKLAVTNKAGQFFFEKIADGNYRVSATATGYENVFSEIVNIDAQKQNVNLPAMILHPVVKALTSVAVTAKKPLIEQKTDRTIVNVDASITNTGTSALEVLEKSPGITVDKDGNISLKGKSGVMIMIDGRPAQLSGADLANMLRNMNSSELDQVEIMTNPPARYDAAGNAGIINLKTKKTITKGMNGSASVAYSQGKYPKTNEGFNFNYREGKINFFANLSHNYMKRYSILSIDRNISDDNTNTVTHIFNQQANRVSTGNSYNTKFGVDFFATKKTTFGAVINISSRGMMSSNPNTTNIYSASKELESITKALVNNDAGWNSINSNLNFRSVLDKKGTTLTSDIDVVNHSSQNRLFMINSYTAASGNTPGKSDSLTGQLPQDIRIYSARIDYMHPLKKNIKLETGVKSSIVKTDNNASYDSIQNQIPVHDFNRSNHFAYEENINAAYANLQTPLSKKITLQLGLRLENTNAKGRQRTTGQNFDRHYTQLFPTAYFQYKLNDKNNFGTGFGRRVSRPGYQRLNPFTRFIDRYTFSQGNPNLKPAVSNNIELSHSWKNKITTTLNYAVVQDVTEEIIQQKGREAYNMPANVASLKQFGIAVNANTAITKWWSSDISINVFNDRYEGTVNDIPIDRAATSFILNGVQQFKINKTFTAEINGRYRSGWLEGIMRVRPVVIIGAGISKQVLKNAGSIRITARDIFHTQKLSGITRYGNVDLAMRQSNESQIFSIGFSYRFSKGKKIAPIKRTQGSANEEQDRI